MYATISSQTLQACPWLYYVAKEHQRTPSTIVSGVINTIYILTFAGIGWTMFVSSWLCTIYYNMLIAYAVFYIVASLSDQLPWKTCGHWWNTAGTCFHHL